MSNRRTCGGFEFLDCFCLVRQGVGPFGHEKMGSRSLDGVLDGVLEQLLRL